MKYPMIEKILSEYDPGVTHFTSEELSEMVGESANRAFDNARISALAGIEQMIEIVDARADEFLNEGVKDQMLTNLKEAWQTIQDA